MTTPPGGAPNVAAWVSIRPEVQPVPGSVPLCRARRTRLPVPSRKTLAALFVMVSISPVPKLLPGPVSYFQAAVSTPDPAAPLNSSLQVRVKPAGGAGVAAWAGAEPASGATATVPVRRRVADSSARRRGRLGWTARNRLDMGSPTTGQGSASHDTVGAGTGTGM